MLFVCVSHSQHSILCTSPSAYHQSAPARRTSSHCIGTCKILLGLQQCFTLQSALQVTRSHHGMLHPPVSMCDTSMCDTSIVIRVVHRLHTAVPVEGLGWRCAAALQDKQVELDQLQSALKEDAASLAQQLSTFETRREDAIRELQVLRASRFLTAYCVDPGNVQHPSYSAQ